MADPRPRVALLPRTPWSLRLFDRLPLSDLQSGILVGVALFGVFLAYTSLLGPGPGQLDRIRGFESGTGWLAELLQDVLLGLTLAIAASSVRDARRELAALADHLVARPSGPGYEAMRLGVSGTWLLAAGLVGVVSAWVAVVYDPTLWEGGVRPAWTHPSVVWLVARNLLVWWFLTRTMALELSLARGLSRLGECLRPELEVLDRSPFAPFGHRALRNVFVWMLLSAYLSLTYLGENWAGANLLLALVILTTFAACAFVLPLLGPRRFLRARKAQELARLRDAIREARDGVLAAPGGSEPAQAGRLADLLAYDARIRERPDWPLDAGALLRVAFYVAFGLGSWVGAALVERALAAALG